MLLGIQKWTHSYRVVHILCTAASVQERQDKAWALTFGWPGGFGRAESED